MSIDTASTWTYRSFHNRPDTVGDDPNKALALIFAEATMIFQVPPKAGSVLGILDMGGGYFLDLAGDLLPSDGVYPSVARIAGVGRVETPTENWEYDYHGFIVPTWAKGIDQHAAFVGSILRARPHGSAKAGYTASFIAVLQT
ncbi:MULTISPECIES: hypothetical protein [Paraburkholderia]|uniref:hypothetical protein n=1 Tax=Paraburkholderia TaxID=1822464 RepID=UPI0022537348|nr:MULTISPECIES: hypothetical protein [Paraburkholderia]MCX4177750.1 hypothetical protein [Paraburkholderia madseniana]MDQ6465737.1 hypothetical protein [Paraburkholderia madseniana]